MMTPGHVTYCAKVEGEVNKFADSHVPVIDILRTDGALMKECFFHSIMSTSGQLLPRLNQELTSAFKQAPEVTRMYLRF